MLFAQFLLTRAIFFIIIQAYDPFRFPAGQGGWRVYVRFPFGGHLCRWSGQGGEPEPDPQRQPNGFLSPSLQIGLLGLTFSIQAAILFSIAAICAGQLKDTLIRHESFPLIMSRVEGTLLLLIAIGLMFL